MGAQVIEAAAKVAETAGKAAKGAGNAAKGAAGTVTDTAKTAATGTAHATKGAANGIGDIPSKLGKTKAWKSATRIQNSGNSTFNPLNLGMLLLGILLIMCGIYNKTPREIIASLATGKLPSTGGSGSSNPNQADLPDSDAPKGGNRVTKDIAAVEHGADKSPLAKAATNSGAKAGGWLAKHTGGLIGSSNSGVGKVLNGANDGINKVVFGKDYDTEKSFVHKDPFAK